MEAFAEKFYALTDYWENTLFKDWVLLHPYDNSNTDTLLVSGTPWVPICAVVAYLLTIIIVPSLLKAVGAPPIFMRKVAAMWNLFLSVISFFMLMGVGLPFGSDILRRGLKESVCDVNHWHFNSGAKGCVFWAYIFALSKYAELFDTVFLLLRQRPVPFLHWWHHTTVLLFTWFAEYYHMSAGYVFICVNAFVHCFMYFYYFLSEMGRRPGKSVAMAITVIQITQMFVGIFTVGSAMYWYYVENLNCSNSAPQAMFISGIIMYGSYLFLFVRFFINRYIFGAGRPAGGKPAVKPASKPKKGAKGKKAVKAD
mmetsp:Transcript_8412/g.35176  ORF Transcript_8412/g.35176 Transcript_8412/m.35176 type:complete len:311 (-) Transcript_8412:32-964(-)